MGWASDWASLWTFGPMKGLAVGLGFGLGFGLVQGLFKGWGAALQHYILRFWLWRSHTFPFRVVSFLNDATTRFLLKRQFGGYSFSHELLQHYFTDVKMTPTAALPSASPQAQ